MKYFGFLCPDIFGHVEKQLNKKAKVSFKIYYAINWEIIIIIHILPNILRSKDNQAMKFGLLIKYNVRNFFF